MIDKLNDLAFELDTCFYEKGTIVDGKRKKYPVNLSYKGRHIREVMDEMEALLKEMEIK